MSDDLIAEALLAHFGTRCETLDMDDFPDLGTHGKGRCPCCVAWEQYDSLRADVERLTASLAAEVEESERLRAALADERRHGGELAEALAKVDEHCQNEGYGNAIVNERIVDRCEETARDALDKHRARRQG